MSVETMVTGSGFVVRDPGFALRLEQACDAHPHCPPAQRGRMAWLQQQFKSRFDIDVSNEGVRKWMLGVSKPKGVKHVKLAELLGVDDAWLYVGTDTVSPSERKVRNALASGAANVVAGLIQMDGGSPAFPDDDDKMAKREKIDLYAIIKGAKYQFSIVSGISEGEDWVFEVPQFSENVMVLGLIKDGFNIGLIEIDKEVIANEGKLSRGLHSLRLSKGQLTERRIESFSQRL